MYHLQNKLLLNTFGLVYLFEYDFKCYYKKIAPGHLILITFKLKKNKKFQHFFAFSFQIL